METGMDVAENSKRDKVIQKYLYKLEIGILKVIPMVLALICFLNTILCYFGYDLIILTYLGGISILTLGFLYISSYAFRFCEYHRMFLHYVTLINILSYIDMEFGIPFNSFNLLVLYTSIAVIFMFLIIISIKNEHNQKDNK